MQLLLKIRSNQFTNNMSIHNQSIVHYTTYNIHYTVSITPIIHDIPCIMCILHCTNIKIMYITFNYVYIEHVLESQASGLSLTIQTISFHVLQQQA